MTGFRVLYDNIATSFSISRRRMMVPIYKKWEASLTRIQIVRQERVVQLLAFFNDFNHGKCMNFVLKGTDTMESFMRNGKFWIRFVDCKFALPKTEDDPSSDFLCLDIPDYPIEHDDISIAFDTEAGMFSVWGLVWFSGVWLLTKQIGRTSKLQCRGRFGNHPGWHLFGGDFASTEHMIFPTYLECSNCCL